MTAPAADGEVPRRCEIHRVRLADFCRAIRKHSLITGVGTYLAMRRGQIVPLGEIVDWVYADREDGGPDFARSCVYHTILSLRARGLPIINFPARGYSWPLER